MRPTLVRLLVLAMIAAVGFVAAPASSQLVSEQANLRVYLPLAMRRYHDVETTFGVSMISISPWRGLAQLKAAGSAWVRTEPLRWDLVEPLPGERQWSVLAEVENQMLLARNHGMNYVAVVSGAPDWAQKVPGAICGPIDESALPAFGQFMNALVARYSAPPYSVKYWELWSEPDISPAQVPADSGFGCWGDESDPYFGGAYYAEMLKTVYPLIKTADPQAQVLVGGLLLNCDPRLPGACSSELETAAAKFFEGMLIHNGANDGGDYFDGVSFHAYDYYGNDLGAYSHQNWNSSVFTTGPVVKAKANYLLDLLADPVFGAPGKYLLNSEQAILCGGPSDPPGEPPCGDELNSQFELTKAYYMVHSLAVAQALDLHASIWYEVLGWRNSGILYPDLSPRLAYNAFAFGRRELSGGVLLNTIDTYEGLSGYAFDRGDIILWVVWSTDSAKHRIDLIQLPRAVFGTFGQVIAPTLSPYIGIEPVYIEWDK